MKKFVYLFFIAYLCAACVSVGVFAQQQKANPQNPSLSSNKPASSTADGRSFGKGSKFLNLGAGLAAYSYANAGFFPALSASLDVGFKETLDPAHWVWAVRWAIGSRATTMVTTTDQLGATLCWQRGVLTTSMR